MTEEIGGWTLMAKAGGGGCNAKNPVLGVTKAVQKAGVLKQMGFAQKSRKAPKHEDGGAESDVNGRAESVTSEVQGDEQGDEQSDEQGDEQGDGLDAQVETTVTFLLTSTLTMILCVQFAHVYL